MNKSKKINQHECLKRKIFEKYLVTRKVSDKDWKFCEKIDWHPVDELPLKKEFIKKLKRIEKEKTIKLNNVKELFNRMKKI